MTGTAVATDGVSQAQRKAAKVVGWAYLLALLPAIFAEFYVRGQLVVFDDAAQTALKIAANERLFRLGIASNLAVFAVDVALITALYVVLEPVDRGLALLALGWGLIETAVLVTVALKDLEVLQALSGGEHLGTFAADRLAMLSIRAHGAAYSVGLVFSGLRGTAFCCLWLRSRYIPASLAAWGLSASILMGATALLLIVAPGVAEAIPVAVYGGPIFLFELTMGFWLLFKGLAPSRWAVAPRAAP
jgi:hypothetical protein